MKKINYWRFLVLALTFGMMFLEACAVFKPKCDCPKW